MNNQEVIALIKEVKEVYALSLQAQNQALSISSAEVLLNLLTLYNKKADEAKEPIKQVDKADRKG